ncbi:CRE-NAS-32 protein [Aphelenchoides avenae]|nr:CRE-NAS-32 protein [Aphelenchus avenae]
MALEGNGANVTDASASILAQNKPLSDFLYQGDLLLTEADAIRLNFTTTLKQRRAGGIIPLTNGYKLEAQKWPHDTPICYRFEDGSDDFTMLIARKAFQFWTENSCLTWQEGCAGKPTVKVTTNGVGCFTTKGRAAGVEIRPFTSADGRTEEKVVPIFDGEQHLSLGAPGCSWFRRATHEASHVVGMGHEQTRLDRDQHIEVVWSNIADDWKLQYDKAESSQTFGIPYDYGSNMHYTGYANDPKIDMMAKKPIYQHTMGNTVGPIFNDIKFVNMYNDCMYKDGVKCENDGFPHPRDCSKCICPEGFGGRTCIERQQGWPLSCGTQFTAGPEWQTATVRVLAPVGVGPYTAEEDKRISIYPACCHYWIKGKGKRVMLKFDRVYSGPEFECTNACDYGATEVKWENLTMGGARVCCPQHAQEFGTAVSSFDLMIVRVCSLRNKQTAIIRFRTTDDYGPPLAVVVTDGNAPPNSDGPVVVGGN